MTTIGGGVAAAVAVVAAGRLAGRAWLLFGCDCKCHNNELELISLKQHQARGCCFELEDRA